MWISVVTKIRKCISWGNRWDFDIGMNAGVPWQFIGRSVPFRLYLADPLGIGHRYIQWGKDVWHAWFIFQRVLYTDTIMI